MVKGRKKSKIEIAPRDHLAARLLKLATATTRLLSPRYDTAEVHDLVQSAREALANAGAQVNLLPDDWKPGAPKPKITAAQLEKKKARLAKLQAELEALEG
jgi:uncharacterized protein YigA (DUF484 family)